MNNDPWGAPPQNDPWGGAPASNDPWGGSPAQPAIPEHQMQAPDADEMFGGASVKGFSFDGAPPLRLGGLVTEKPESLQKRDFDTNEPMFWKDGRPRWQVRVLCQTDARVDDDDDGIRAHYLEFKKMDAVKVALKRSGAKTVEQGSHLFLTYQAPAPAKGKAKEYSAEYYPPGVTPPAQAPVQASAGWGAPPPSAAPSGPPQQAQIAMQAGASPELARALCDKGLTVEEAQRLSSLTAGWQQASAEQILPYVRRPANEPPF